MPSYCPRCQAGRLCSQKAPRLGNSFVAEIPQHLTMSSFLSHNSTQAWCCEMCHLSWLLRIVIGWELRMVILIRWCPVNFPPRKKVVSRDVAKQEIQRPETHAWDSCCCHISQIVSCPLLCPWIHCHWAAQAAGWLHRSTHNQRSYFATWMGAGYKLSPNFL